MSKVKTHLSDLILCKHNFTNSLVASLPQGSF